MTKLNRTVINHLHSLNSPFLPLVDLFTGLFTFAGESGLFRFQTIPVFLKLHWCYSTTNHEQAPSYPQDQTVWAVLDWSMRIVPRICKLEMFLLLSLLVSLVDPAQLPDLSSLLTVLQHGFFLDFNLPEKICSIMAFPWAAASFRNSWPALLWHSFQAAG